MIGRIVPGFLSDCLEQFNMMYFVSTLSGVLVLAFQLPLEYHPTTAGIIIFALLFDFASGGFVSLSLPCAVELAEGKGRKPTRNSKVSVSPPHLGLLLDYRLRVLSEIKEGLAKDLWD